MSHHHHDALGKRKPDCGCRYQEVSYSLESSACWCDRQMAETLMERIESITEKASTSAKVN